MDKRYQVFVSSTFADLQEERQRVIQTLMEMDCIPSGMELFPAADEDQFDFIKKVIDDCDYYLLIIGGRYGSVGTDGASYTEKEYEYALERGIKVLAFLHEDPSQIPLAKSEASETLRERLRVFREKVKTGRLVQFWKTADQLPGLVALSLSKTIKTYPAVGWVRGDAISSTETLSEINDLHKQNTSLLQEVAQLRNSLTPRLANLAGLDDTTTVRFKYWFSKMKYEDHVKATWREIFAFIAPYLIAFPTDFSVKQQLSEDLFKKLQTKGDTVVINDQDFQTIKVQLSALNLVSVDYTKTTNGGMGLFWSLTPQGKAMMVELRTVKLKSPS